MAEEKTFHWADYLVFVASLLMTAAIGLFFSFWKRKKTDNDELFLASRSMHFIPVALSMSASILNGVFILGFPADVHYTGLVGMWITVGLILVSPVAAHVILPTFYNLRLTSAYEYLELRYNFAVRVAGSFTITLTLLLFLAVVLYAPALAFSQVTTLSLPMSIILTGAICTIYTAMGGIKAVIWTDTIQMGILLVGLLVLIIVGAGNQGGLGPVWEAAKASGRDNWFNFSPDPRIRYTFWGQTFGQWVIWLGVFFSNQMIIQRFMTISNFKHAQVAQYMVWITIDILFLLVSILGLIIYATYRECDPLVLGKATKGEHGIMSGDQIVPYFLMDTLGHLPGLPGLFTSSVFAAALSSVSSAVNSLSALLLEDVIKPTYYAVTKKTLSERRATRLSIGLAIFFGCLTVALSFVAEHMTKKLVEATGTIWGIVSGPLAGLFMMGFFFPWVNAIGAMSALVVSLAASLWLAIGGLMYKIPEPPLEIGDCGFPLLISSNITGPPPGGDLQDFYQISFAWYGVFSVGTCLIVGNVVSLLSHAYSRIFSKGKEPSKDKLFKDPKLYYSCADNCYCWCPARCKKRCRCGIPYEIGYTDVAMKNIDVKA